MLNICICCTLVMSFYFISWHTNSSDQAEIFITSEHAVVTTEVKEQKWLPLTEQENFFWSPIRLNCQTLHWTSSITRNWRLQSFAFVFILEHQASFDVTYRISLILTMVMHGLTGQFFSFKVLKLYLFVSLRARSISWQPRHLSFRSCQYASPI